MNNKRETFPKIACLISGFLRRFEIMLDSCPPESGCRKGGYLRERILDSLNCDIFVSTYNIRGYGGRAFHDYGNGNSNNGDLLSANYIASVFHHHQHQQQKKRKSSSSPTSQLVGLQVQPFLASSSSSFSFENLFIKMEEKPKSKDFYFSQAKPRKFSSKNYDSSVGLLGNGKWEMRRKTENDGDNEKQQDSWSFVKDDTKQFLRRNDYSQVYKQYCVWEMAVLYEEEEQYFYDFFYRLRMDLKPRKVLSLSGFDYENKILRFQLLKPQNSNDVVDKNRKQNQQDREEHFISPNRLHVHTNDFSDFVMFSERKIAKEMLVTKIWQNQLVKSLIILSNSSEGEEEENHHKSSSSSSSSSLIFPVYVSDRQDKQLLREREIHFHDKFRDKIRSEFGQQGGSDADRTIKERRRQHLVSGSFAEFNLMFWRQIFEISSSSSSSSSSSLVEVDYDEEGYMKMDSKRMFMG